MGRSAREQHHLSTRDKTQHGLDVLSEPHVEHVVGFIENDMFHISDLQTPRIQVVSQSAGSDDQDINPFFQDFDLVSRCDSPMEHCSLEGVRGGQDLEVALYLTSKLSSGSHHKHPRTSTLCETELRVRDISHHALNHWKTKSHSVASFILRTDNHIFTKENWMKRLMLNAVEVSDALCLKCVATLDRHHGLSLNGNHTLIEQGRTLVGEDLCNLERRRVKRYLTAIKSSVDFEVSWSNVFTRNSDEV
mmetsp:Transcript_15755/g.20447  ORF Transcript_15755/g.20447 Transcript_15755/m.20447 type:complete len:248 (-) Transcript_15755:937-1680(-)